MSLIDLIYLLIRLYLRHLLRKYAQKKIEGTVIKKSLDKFCESIETIKRKLKVPRATHYIQKGVNKIKETIKFVEHWEDAKKVVSKNISKMDVATRSNSWFRTKTEALQATFKKHETKLDKALDVVLDFKMDDVEFVKEVQRKIADIEISFKQPDNIKSVDKALELTDETTHQQVQEEINKTFEQLPNETKKEVYETLDIKPNIWIKVSSGWIYAMRFFIGNDKTEQEADYGRIDYITIHKTRAGNNYYQGTYEHLFFDFCAAVQARMVPKGKTKFMKKPNKNGYYPYWNNGAGNIIWRLFGANKHPMR